jgi:predicted nucleic acid-binding protein
MATTAVDPVFVDTNVLVFSTVPSAPLHIAAKQKLAAVRGAGVVLWTSRQVLREYIAALTRPQSYAAPPPVATIIADVAFFQNRMQIAEDDRRVTAQLLGLLGTIPFGGKQVHDANIVATMVTYTIPKLLTHNTADFARFASVIAVEPLV